MPHSSSPEPKAEKSFAELLQELPAENDFVTLVGVVTRSPKEGHFRLTPQGGGRPVELPIEAVRGHSVLHREHGYLLVQLEAERGKIEEQLASYEELFYQGVGTRTYLTSPYWWAMDRSHLWKVQLDPGAVQQEEAVRLYPGDPTCHGAAGLAPFVLATPHHAPAGSLAMQSAGLQQQVGMPFAPKPPAADLIQGGTISDPALLRKITIFDHTLKEVVKDPLSDHNTLIVADLNRF